MNCCDMNGNCNQGRDCPARAPRVPAKRRTCDELGVCQRIDCLGEDPIECELPCRLEPARPMFPFAPSTIEGPRAPGWSGLGDDGAMLTRRQNLSVLLLVLLCAALGSMVGGFLAGYLSWPTWLIVGLPG